MFYVDLGNSNPLTVQTLCGTLLGDKTMKSVHHIDGSIYNNDIFNLKLVEQEDNLEDFNKVLETRCHYCDRIISLYDCEYDKEEWPICRGNCYG